MDDKNRVIIGYDDGPKDQVILEEKPSKEDAKNSCIALGILFIGFLIGGRFSFLFSIVSLVITFSVKKRSVLTYMVILGAIIDIIATIVSML